jgi:hypothetical protein
VPVSAIRSKRQQNVSAILIAIGVVLVIPYLIWCARLGLGATEGDVPSASSLALPKGSATSTDMSCGSGGCWSIFTVLPGAGSSPSELRDYLETTFDGRVPGTFWDPRTITFQAEVDGKSVVVTASYWITYD